MDLYVEDGVKAAAAGCPDGLSCLSGDGAAVCKILACIEDGTLFIQCQDDARCFFQREEEERTACTCPVRRRLHERYGV